jgi:hypothetical protein
MITNTLTDLHNGSDVCVPASSASWVSYHELEGRRIAPVFAPATGEVRPKTDDSALIAAPQGMGTAWGHTWRPPD